MNYYLILGIPQDADDETTRRAFRSLARRYHPDAGPGSSPEKFREVVKAYETLRNPFRRAAYDASLGREPHKRYIRVEPLRTESTRVEPLRQEILFPDHIIEQLLKALLRDLDDAAFFNPPFRRW
jgi:curved DNA-binding protein CbpA